MSQTHFVSNQETRVFLWGLLGFLVTFSIIRSLQGLHFYKLTFLLLGAALPMGLVCITLLKSHTQIDSGLAIPQHDARIDFPRILIKLLGLLFTLTVLIFGYWLFPEYQKPVYEVFIQSAIYLPWCFLLAIPYFIWIDRRMIDPFDGYWHTGCLLLGRWSRVEFQVLKAHALGWAVKGFFLPFMYSYLSEDLEKLLTHPLVFNSYIEFYHFCWNFLICIDLLFASLGYLFTLRCLNAHIRSTDSTCLGWCAALVCYPPFWSVMETSYLNYYNTLEWDVWLAAYPSLQVIWSIVILGLMTIYTWATLVFGFRFSNLTHRGIIRDGPYRYLKHPAYVCKNLAWWLIAIPFIPMAGGLEAGRHCTLLLLLNGIYALRAWTEENHLQRDPAYREYAAWIRKHGFMAHLRNYGLGMKDRIS